MKRRIMKQQRSYVVIIPKPIVDGQRLEKGDDLEFTTKGSQIIMEKIGEEKNEQNKKS